MSDDPAPRCVECGRPSTFTQCAACVDRARRWLIARAELLAWKREPSVRAGRL